MAVELYIDVLILEDDLCINWLMWKCGIRVLTGDIALISTDDPPNMKLGSLYRVRFSSKSKFEVKL